MLGLPALAALSADGSERFVEWRRPPPAPAGGFAALSPLLVDGAGRPIESRPAWERRRREPRREWQTVLGPFPRPVALRAEALTTTEASDHTRLLLRYRSEAAGAAGEYVPNEAYLLIPKDGRRRRSPSECRRSGPANSDAGTHRYGRAPFGVTLKAATAAPAMVVLHQTTDRTIDEPVGIAGREPMQIALHLVRRGYVCIVPRCFLWGYAGTSDLRAATERLLATSPWKTGMAKMVWDGMRAVDLLETRPEVDRKRVGCIGHSLGGKTALYLGAFDERIAATVSCEGGVGLSFSNWHDPWYLGARIQEPGFPRDHHELIALTAPRPFLLIGGGDADGPQSWPYIAANLPVYRLLGAEERLGLQLTGQGHDFPHAGPEREKTLAWLDHWLKHTPPSRP